MKSHWALILAGALAANGWLAVGRTAVAEPVAPPDLTLDLGAQNTGIGLVVPSGGDGMNIAETVEGIPVRRVQGDKSHYLYVAISHPAYAKGPLDLYVTVEAFDESFARITVHYDRDAPTPTLETRYAEAEGTLLLTGSRRWRRGVFRLPAARLGHGQNHQADFRLAARNLAVRRITVSPRKPDGYDPDQTLDAETLRGLRVNRAPGMELTFGNDAARADAAVYAALSVTSVESYVDWAGVEPEENQWDWSKWDKQVATLKAAGLKWVPFLIAGPAYATPLWFQRGTNSHYYRCLEHDRDSRVQSLFNPELRPWIKRFLKAFAERYRDTGVIESVLLGVTGIYGESIYPAGPEGGWTARLTGDYHNHAGWWAADRYAVAAFREAMEKKYSSIAALNQSWRTAHASFAAVTTFLPARAPSDQARADLAEWYQQAMTEWSLFWATATRRVFPDTEIYLCTGGDGTPSLGADFSAQTKAMAAQNVGIRITNEAGDYAANFTLTREVATATRFYSTFCGFEPAGQVDARGVVARIYNATASGARQLHYYTPNVLNDSAALQNFRAEIAHLTPRQPRVTTALYLSRESWALDPKAIDRLSHLARRLRDLVDLDFVTRLSVADGILRDKQALILAESPVLDPVAAAAIEHFVHGGGVLVTATRTGETIGRRLNDQMAWRTGLLASTKNTDGLLVPKIQGSVPHRWVLNLGQPGDEDWLSGDWFGPERGLEWSTNATKRWSGARPGFLLPTEPGADYTLRLTALLPRQAVGKNGVEVGINGRKVGQFAAAGRQVFELKVPAAVLDKGSVARLEMICQAWKPSADGKSTDTRSLGIAVRQIEWVRTGNEESAPAPAALAFTLDPEQLAAHSKRVGSGWTISLPGLADRPDELMKVLAALWHNTPDHLPGIRSLAPDDGRMDGIYTTTFKDGVLRYDAAAAAIK